jgi:hypothetical protein
LMSAVRLALSAAKSPMKKSEGSKLSVASLVQNSFRLRCRENGWRQIRTTLADVAASYQARQALHGRAGIAAASGGRDAEADRVK